MKSRRLMEAYPKVKDRRLIIAGLEWAVACIATKSGASFPVWVISVEDDQG